MLRAPVASVIRWILSALIAAFFAGCTTTHVRTTDFTPANSVDVEAPDEYLLDVNVVLFDPGLDAVEDEELVYSGTRNSESVWVAARLKDTLDISRGWGATRVVPDDDFSGDITITGKILLSNGESMLVHVRAVDAIGNVWIDQTYDQSVSHYAYSEARVDNSDAFQGLYNDISNDLLEKLHLHSPEQRLAIRSVSDLQFAQNFAPDAFSEHLVKDENGLFRVDRLPAENDPILLRINQIEVRDQLFQDVLQDYYTTFSLQMDGPYTLWRKQSYVETIAIQQLESSAQADRAAGIAGIVLGVAAQASGDETVRTAGVIGITGGALTIQSGFRKSDEALLHEAVLQEMSSSLETTLEPSVIDLQDRTITLSGTVRQQYQQWQEVMREIYYKETGYTPSFTDSPVDEDDSESDNDGVQI